MKHVHTLLQFVGEIDPSQRCNVSEIALPLPAEQVALQRLRIQDSTVIRGVDCPKICVFCKHVRSHHTQTLR